MSPLLSQYTYTLPNELIARTPADPRDAAQLFVYDTKTGKMTFDVFVNLANYIPTPARMVFNTTKVVPARVTLTKETGGKVEVLVLVNEFKEGDDWLRIIVDRKVEVGNRLSFPDGKQLTVVAQEKNVFTCAMNFEHSLLQDALYQYGETPVPRYIDTTLDEKTLRERYQTIFAEKPKSIAAPTASLHFTHRVLDSLKAKGIEKSTIDLHVGLGTFSTLTEDMIREGKLHVEHYSISATEAHTIATAKRDGVKIISVGTTTTRALESSGREILEIPNDDMHASTDIFIKPPYQFQIIDGLITNFHLPGTSLICLVDAFLKYKQAPHGIIDLYKVAIDEKFKFYSFGDAMLII